MKDNFLILSVLNSEAWTTESITRAYVKHKMWTCPANWKKCWMQNSNLRDREDVSGEPVESEGGGEAVCEN